MDQLHRGLLSKRPPPGVLLTDSGFCPSFPAIHELIDDELETLANKAEWPYVPGDETASGSSTDSGAGMSRQQKARDILSAFNEKIIPEEFLWEIERSRNVIARSASWLARVIVSGVLSYDSMLAQADSKLSAMML